MKAKVPISFPSSSSKYDEEYYTPKNAKNKNSFNIYLNIMLVLVVLFIIFIIAL